MTSNETPGTNDGLKCLSEIERFLVAGEWRYLSLDQQAELQREQDLGKARDGDTEDFEERYGLGSGGIHEILDRAFVAQDTWERFILDHPSTLLDPDLYLVATQVLRLMGLFYSKAGSRFDGG